MEPIIVIVGFLGAGKTTLLKKLAEDTVKKNWQPYILLNDYENASLDAQQFMDLVGLGWPSCMLRAFILVYGPTDVLKFIPLKTV